MKGIRRCTEASLIGRKSFSDRSAANLVFSVTDVLAALADNLSCNVSISHRKTGTGMRFRSPGRKRITLVTCCGFKKVIVLQCSTDGATKLRPRLCRWSAVEFNYAN